MTDKTDRQKAAEIVRDAGGQIVGRTRLQKVAYLLELAGYGDGFQFEYYHYGPYSDDLADAIRMADAFELIKEDEKPASWGGTYSVFKTTAEIGEASNPERAHFAAEAAKVDSIELELAATAAYLSAVEKATDPWAETARRKPEKAENGRLERAKEAYKQLSKMTTPKPLPKIA